MRSVFRAEIFLFFFRLFRPILKIYFVEIFLKRTIFIIEMVFRSRIRLVKR